ncbi:vacuolar import and degradation protein-domain-containing protein [Lipomyces japonicus]|uniref:vacuolar import and degradation protein-domain-containing protein n=1 Tax=Lipomyces japonicus TaxID=56871 RepID=UPI0034CE391A
MPGLRDSQGRITSFSRLNLTTALQAIAIQAIDSTSLSHTATSPSGRSYTVEEILYGARWPEMSPAPSTEPAAAENDEDFLRRKKTRSSYVCAEDEVLQDVPGLDALPVTSPATPTPLEPASDLVHHNRVLTTSESSFLRSGSKFIGTQQSGRSTYEVHVELKHVSMAESFVCGHLHIQGLTEDHPTLTTYFEGQMIGPKYSFITRRRDWGASEKVDIAHWARFPSWRPLAKQAKRQDYCHTNFDQRDHIFMRWKECFLVPDHRVRDINGASFAGFYYICFNQMTGSISGLYYHESSEKYQQLELSHINDHGNYYAYEFR